MSDKQNPNDPQYDWLYAGDSGAPEDDQRSQGSGGSDGWREPAADDDAEHTQVIDRGASSGPDPADGPEPTQVLGTRPGDIPPPAPPSAPTGRPAEPPPPPPPASTSFGGTYAPPPSSPPPSEPRYATPSANQGPGPGAPAGPGGPGGGSRDRVATQPPPRSGKKRNWWIRGALILLAAWLVFLIVVPLWAWKKISQVDAEPDGDRPPDTPGTTFLLVGSDSREGLSEEQRGELGTGNAGGQRTDTIILLHVPDGDGPRLLLSIPRDSYVDIPGHGKNKINAAFSIGGPELLVETVEKAMDVRVDDYVEVGFTGFVDIVDAVGGITVCPETAIDDPKAGHLKLDKGCQEVDGTTALGYSRSRDFPLGDITRAEHQREVITQVGKAAASWKTVVLPWRYLKVNKAAAESLQIGDNVGPIALMQFAWAMSHTSGSDAKRCVVPYTSLGTSTDVGSVVTWDDAKANAIFAAIREDDTSSITCSATGQS